MIWLRWLGGKVVFVGKLSKAKLVACVNLRFGSDQLSKSNGNSHSAFVVIRTPHCGTFHPNDRFTIS